MDRTSFILFFLFFVRVELVTLKFKCTLDKHWYPCGSCVGTCRKPDATCPESCEEGVCDCYPDYVKNDNGECVDYDHCFVPFITSSNEDSANYLSKVYQCEKSPTTEKCLKRCNKMPLPKVILMKICRKQCCPGEKRGTNIMKPTSIENCV